MCLRDACKNVQVLDLAWLAFLGKVQNYSPPCLASASSLFSETASALKLWPKKCSC